MTTPSKSRAHRIPQTLTLNQTPKISAALPPTWRLIGIVARLWSAAEAVSIASWRARRDPESDAMRSAGPRGRGVIDWTRRDSPSGVDPEPTPDFVPLHTLMQAAQGRAQTQSEEHARLVSHRLLALLGCRGRPRNRAPMLRENRYHDSLPI